MEQTASEVDVVVVGAGGAGLAAAIAAREAGATVMVVEAAAVVGGSTALAGGSIMAAGTPVQKAAGYPDDSVEEFFGHYLTFNRWEVEPAVVRRFCDDSAPTLAWLMDLGVEFRPEDLYRAGSERVPRSHRPVGAGAAIVAALHRRCRDLDVDIALGTRVDGLVVEGGRVRGITADGQDLRAGAVVVTSGGFAHNEELLREHLPDLRFADGPIRTPAPPTNVGDGLALGAEAGAATTGRGHGVVLLSPGIVSDIEPFLPGWLVFVDGGGERYVNELAPYSVVTPLTVARGGTCWVIFDHASCQAARPQPGSAWGAGTWVTETLLAAAERGQVATAPDLAGLAERMGVPGPALEGTIDRYNRSCRDGHDHHFFKDPAALQPVADPPFYAARMTPSIVPLTGYGLRIDPDARVLASSDLRPVPGLYAAGEVTGSVLGPQYLGGGNAVTSAVLFGRVAGQTAVTDARTVTG